MAGHELVYRASLVDLHHPADGRLVDVGELQHQAGEAEVAAERDDERRQPEPGDQRPLDEPEEAHRRQPAEDPQPPRQRDRRRDQLRDHERADAGAKADRQVDLAQQQHEDLGRAEHDEQRCLDHQVDEVLGGQELRALDLEEDHDRDQADEHGHGAGLTVLDPLPPCLEVLADRGRQHLWRRRGQLLVCDRGRWRVWSLR